MCHVFTEQKGGIENGEARQLPWNGMIEFNDWLLFFSGKKIEFVLNEKSF